MRGTWLAELVSFVGGKPIVGAPKLRRDMGLNCSWQRWHMHIGGPQEDQIPVQYGLDVGSTLLVPFKREL